MAEPEVVRVMREFKAALLDREAEAMARMGLRWREVERSLEMRIQSLLDEIQLLRETEHEPSRGQLLRMERYQSLLRQVREELAGYEAWATQQIAAEQRELARMGIESAQVAIRASGVRVAFNRLPVSAVENMVGLAGDGSPLFAVLQKRALWPEAVDGLTSALTKGVALGWNPRKTASRMADGLAQGLNKALLIARTEQLRVYRHASVEQYRASGVVSKMKRLAAKDDRTCMACLMSDGELLELDEELSDHPGGRCTSVPVVKGMPEVTWQTGREWFERQGPERQREMMGPKYYDAWRGGKFDLGRLRTTVHSEIWGDSPKVRPLSELLAA